MDNNNREKEFNKDAGFTLGTVVWMVDDTRGGVYACVDKPTAEAIAKYLQYSYEMGGGTQWGKPNVWNTQVRQVKPAALKRIMSLKESVTPASTGSKLPDLSRWWEYPSAQILGTVYWLQNQIPPQDKAARAAAWEKLKVKLQKKHPAPNVQ